MRWLSVTLCVLLVFPGCTTTRPVTDVDLRRQLTPGKGALVVSTADGSTVRVDPNTELRFMLRTGEVTPWVRGRELWRSDLGVSFGEGGGVFFFEWSEVIGSEVRNLSGGKTVGAVLLIAVAIGVIVILIAGGAKGGGGSSISTGGKRSRGKTAFGRAPRAKRRRLARTSGGVHVHVPLIVLSTSPQYYYHGPRDVAPPPPPPPPPVRARPPPPPPAGSGEVVDVQGPAAAVAPKQQATARRAMSLFSGSILRRSRIQLIGNIAAGTELARFDGYTGSVVVGIRIKNAFELGAGFRHTLASQNKTLGPGLDSGFQAFGRIGGHFYVDDRHRFAVPLHLDIGSGHNIFLQTRLSIGLRVNLLRSFWIGLLPFSPNFTYFEEESEFLGAKRWTFPTTLELGFNF